LKTLAPLLRVYPLYKTNSTIFDFTVFIWRISAIDGLFFGSFYKIKSINSLISFEYGKFYGIGACYSVTILNTSPSKLSASNGFFNAQSSYKMQPKAQTSDFDV